MKNRFRDDKNSWIYLNVIASGTEYMNAFIWKVHKKNVRKWSNISVKKYQNKPMFGVSSGTVNLCVEDKKCESERYHSCCDTASIKPNWDETI